MLFFRSQISSVSLIGGFKRFTSQSPLFQENQNSSKSNSESRNTYGKYLFCSAITLSALGAYYLYNSEFKKVYALVQKSQTCGIRRNDLRTFSAEEVGKHDNKESGILISYKEGVYDITDFVEKHPGGPTKIMMAAGSSIEPFWHIFANHNQSDIYQLLESLRIGNLATEDVNSDMDKFDDPYAKEPSPHSTIPSLNVL